MKAIWNGAVLAESDDTVVVEGNHYFPSAALRREHFRPSDTHPTCGWKGIASYFDVVVGEASELCPVSRLFAGAKITVDATLEPAS